MDFDQRSFLRRLAAALLLLASWPSHADAPIWSSQAERMEANCASRVPSQIRAPNGRVSVKVHCRAGPDGADGRLLRIGLVNVGTGYSLVNTPEGSAELLWAPNSQRFFVNGGFNAYSGFFFRVFDIRRPLRGRDITAAAQRDMVRLFPPCKALNHGDDCKRMERHPEFNMSALAWGRSGASIIVFAGVPCSSSYGGIMCQVQGYELEALSGKILRRISAQQLKTQWQASMAFEMHIPDPPEYDQTAVTQKQ